jgi:acetylglutamate kinase
MDKFDMDSIIKKAGILIEALPYIQKLSGKTVVIKYGGNSMINDQLKNSVMEDITLLKYIGMKPIVIHGGGPDITEALKTYQIDCQFINGLRVTDIDTMTVAQMVLVGKTNKEIVSLISKKGGKAIGLCGIDGNLLECEKYDAGKDENGKQLDLGFVGKIVNINSRILDILTDDEYIPVIAPIGVDANGQSYNINADTVAGEIASHLKAEKLILLTDVDGVQNNDQIIPVLTVDEADTLIKSGVISGGMIPKVTGCLDAVNRGVGRAHIINGTVPHCILLEIFTNKGIGTMFTKDHTRYFENENI